MNPNQSDWATNYYAALDRLERDRSAARQAQLHRQAMARRKKRKNGGPR